MTTIGPKTASWATLLDDIADTLVNNHGGEWSEPDASVTNDQSDGTWSNNARLLQHSTSGVYLLLYVAYGEGFRDSRDNNTNGGIRAVTSDGWDTNNTHPTNQTSTVNQDPFSGSVANDRQASFVNDGTPNNNCAHGIYPLATRGNNYQNIDTSSRATVAANAQATYTISVTADHIAVSAYNTDDTNNGSAGWFVWEHISTKIWADGIRPYFMLSATNTSADRGMASYGFSWVNNDKNDPASRADYNRTDQGRWGYINPDANDDTYFFAYPTIYTTAGGGNNPVGHPDTFIKNTDTNGSTGDTVTYDGTDYRLFQETGSIGNSIAVGLKNV